MAALCLEGATLGQRHRSLNQLTNDTVQKKTPFSEIQNLPELSDVDRLYKIDVAAKYRDLDYILHNLQCEDSLYVSRALNKSTWLITDPLYAEIINPDYLKEKLFPSMTSKAIAKTLSFVRLHLKDEARAELFFKYFEKNYSKKEALKWLPICSVNFIENEVQAGFENIDQDLFKRLCERSFKVFKIFVKESKNHMRLRCYLPAAVFLLYTNIVEFLHLFEVSHDYNHLNLRKNATSTIMKTCPDRVMSNLIIYLPKIHMITFAKHVDKSKIKEVIINLSETNELEQWFSYNHLEPLVQQLPEEEKFPFIVDVFVNKELLENYGCETEDKNADSNIGEQTQFSLSSTAMTKLLAKFGKSVGLKDVYQWYRTAPFDTAFVDLKELIRSETSPYERNRMLTILITCARNDPDHLYTLIQHFCVECAEKTASFKSMFVNSLIEMANMYAIEERTFKMLDKIFDSLGVYRENRHDFLEAIYYIVSYSVLHDRSIPEIVLKKFKNNFKVFKNLVNKLDMPKKTKLFNFLFSVLKKKFDSKALNKKKDFRHVFNSFVDILHLLQCWEKALTEFPFALNFVKYLIKMKTCFKTDICLENIYNIEKKWRRCLFYESLQLVHNEAVFMNALKHQPDLIMQQASLDKILKPNSFDLIRILGKLRVYFPDNFAADFLAIYERKLEDCRTENVGHKAVSRGLCILMEREGFTRMLQAYVPESYKVEWSEEDAAVMNLRKFFAQQMYLVRPTLHIETVLLFAKEDYLQYVLPSLISICHRKSEEECRKFLPTLLGSAVSLQKHGIRLAFEKLELPELTNTFIDVWSATNNVSIRAIIFNLAFNLLCKKKHSAKITDVLRLLELFMHNLSPKENRSVYTTLTQVSKVPESVRAKFCVLSYNFLKGLPADLNCDSLANGLLRDIAMMMDTIDEDFVTQIILNYINEIYTEKKILLESVTSHGYDADVDMLIVKYLICSPSEETQNKRYEKVLKMICEHSLAMWNQICNRELKVRNRFLNLVSLLEKGTKCLFEESEPKYVNPIGLFRSIQRDMNQLSVEENYMFLTRIKLVIAFCESHLEITTGLKLDESDSRQAVMRLAQAFASRCLSILKEDVERYFPSTISLFADALEECISRWYQTAHEFEWYVLYALAADSKNVPANFVAVQLIKDRPFFVEVENMLESNPDRGVRLYLLGLKHVDRQCPWS